MADKKTIAFFTRALAESYDSAVKQVLLYIVREISAGRPVNFQVISAILTRLFKRASKAAKQIATLEAQTFIKLTEKNLNPLRAFIQERNLIMQRGINSYKRSIELGLKNIDAPSFGRRGQDIIREIGLRNVERGILEGSIGKSRDNLLRELRESVTIIDGRFNLEIVPYNGQFRSFNVKTYADLVARTTRREAQNVSNALRAEELGTRLVKWNFIGKNYAALKDPCAIIDGKTYSIEVQGTFIGDKNFPYWRDSIKSGFATPHPNCNHFLRPVSEDLIATLKPGKTFSESTRAAA